MIPTTKYQANAGIISAICAYVLWGLAPIYFKALDNISASEIMIHRVIWSSLLLFVIVILARKWTNFIQIIKTPKIMLRLALTAVILGFNWLIFIWAINNDHLLDASLGYFINPLLNVALGVIFLAERLSKAQLVAVGLAVVGVIVQLAIIGTLPIISLALAGSFGLYGLLRKKLHVDSFIGLLIESLMMLPVAIVYWLFFIESSTANLLENSALLNVLFVCAGIVTTAPLLCFTSAAKRLTLSALGFFQYIGPSIMFFLATYYYNEPLHNAKLITFACIWLALVIYSGDSLRQRKKASPS